MRACTCGCAAVRACGCAYAHARVCRVDAWRAWRVSASTALEASGPLALLHCSHATASPRLLHPVDESWHAACDVWCVACGVATPGRRRYLAAKVPNLRGLRLA